MAYDAGMLAAVVREINCSGVNKIEKIYQPQNDELMITLRGGGRSERLLINVGSNYPRLHFSRAQKENPATAPLFCMIMRKHLLGGKLNFARQIGFERVAELEFDCYDEMGYETKKYLIVEIMGKFSNLMLTDASRKILCAMKNVDFSTSQKRQVLPGMIYELPPSQEKLDPRACDEKAIVEHVIKADPSQRIEKWITGTFMGISAGNAREIAFRAGGRTDSSMDDTTPESLAHQLISSVSFAGSEEATPCILTDAENKMLDYSYLRFGSYASGFTIVEYPSFGEMLDDFYDKKSRNERVHQKAADIFRLLSNAEARIRKKMGIQRDELDECVHGEEYKLWGDLLIGNLYAIKRGDSVARVCNYYDEAMPVVEIPLDIRLSPSQNAQRYYKRYNKSKTAKDALTLQLENGERELNYIATVFDALTRAETEQDLSEIRDELYHAGYASRMKNYTQKKNSAPKLMRFRTTNGYTVLCGRNNLQNDYLTMKLAERSDWWFHVKNAPGSHVVMQSNGEEPDAIDFTEAAEIAAYYSTVSEGVNVPVDYTQIRHIKKPAGAKPGYVIYHVNWSAYVTPKEEKILQMKQK
ncbi:MAG: NFACT family protein [Clostridia bacterium]|nr:NFACT family protein [Clostridia bacterium]